PQLRKKSGNEFRLLVYCGTHSDIYQLVEQMAKQHRVPVGTLSEKTAKLRVIYHPQIIDANELLIKHASPWPDGFISKLSGDMAYDGVCSGSFLLTLQEWGEWEHNVRATFEHKETARKADVKNILPQLEVLMSA